MTQEPEADGGEVERIARAVSKQAIAHLRIRSPLNRTIYGAVRSYRMSNMCEEDDSVFGYPLVDLMSNPAPADISTGEMEIVALVDEIEAALNALTPPQPERPNLGTLAAYEAGKRDGEREAIKRCAQTVDDWGQSNSIIWIYAQAAIEVIRALAAPKGGE